MAMPRTMLMSGGDAGVFDGVEDRCVDVGRVEDGAVAGEGVAVGDDGAVPAELAGGAPAGGRARWRWR